MRSCWKLPLCPTERMPAGSETDPLLAQAEPISDSSNASVITFLRTKKVGTQRKWLPERGVRTCKRNNPADTKVSGEEGEEMLQVLEQRFPCSPWGRPW